MKCGHFLHFPSSTLSCPISFSIPSFVLSFTQGRTQERNIMFSVKLTSQRRQISLTSQERRVNCRRCLRFMTRKVRL